MNLKQSAFLAQLLLEEVDLESDKEHVSSNGHPFYDLPSAGEVAAGNVEGYPTANVSPNYLPM